jgi:hypothetical protein
MLWCYVRVLGCSVCVHPVHNNIMFSVQVLWAGARGTQLSVMKSLNCKMTGIRFSTEVVTRATFHQLGALEGPAGPLSCCQ